MYDIILEECRIVVFFLVEENLWQSVLTSVQGLQVTSRLLISQRQMSNDAHAVLRIRSQLLRRSYQLSRY